MGCQTEILAHFPGGILSWLWGSSGLDLGPEGENKKQGQVGDPGVGGSKAFADLGHLGGKL